MNYIQATSVGKPCVHLPNRTLLLREHNTTRRTSLKLNATTYKHGFPLLKCRQKSTVVCLLGGEDKSDDKQGAPWQDFGKAMGNLGKGQSIENVLRQQIQKQEFYDGDGGKSPPRRGKGGGGGGDSGEPEDEGVSGIIDETLQVVLASIGFLLLYIYIIAGEELTKLGKDYIKYLLGGSKSVRLVNAMETCESFWETLNDNKVVYDKHFLEKEILNTTTWYDGPEKYRTLFRSYSERSADE